MSKHGALALEKAAAKCEKPSGGHTGHETMSLNQQVPLCYALSRTIAWLLTDH